MRTNPYCTLSKIWENTHSCEEKEVRATARWTVHLLFVVVRARAGLRREIAEISDSSLEYEQTGATFTGKARVGAEVRPKARREQGPAWDWTHRSNAHFKEDNLRLNESGCFISWTLEQSAESDQQGLSNQREAHLVIWFTEKHSTINCLGSSEKIHDSRNVVKRSHWVGWLRHLQVKHVESLLDC